MPTDGAATIRERPIFLADWQRALTTRPTRREEIGSPLRMATGAMGWLFYSLTTVALFALWSLLGKIALRTATPVQTTLLYGIAAALVAVAAIAIGQRTVAWSAGTLWVGVLSAACGALGLLTFYLALDRGSASLAVPVIGFYPAVVAVAAVVFLGEKLSALQALGVALAVAGVALIGAAG